METTKEILNELAKTLGDQYAETLTALPMKKQVRECLIDGFRQGVREGVKHTVAMLGVEVKGGK
jgi:hypothetical protein